MKTTNSKTPESRQSKQGITNNKPRPEIRDNMDSRKTKDILPENNAAEKKSKRNY